MNPEIPADAGARYEADGFYLTSSPVLPCDLIDRAVQGMDQVQAWRSDTGLPVMESKAWKPGDDPNKLCKIEQPQFASHAIRELVSHPALGAWAAAITGAEMIQVWWVQLLLKPPSKPGAATNVGWHQDRQYWTAWEDGSEIFTAWVALSDVNSESGPMRFARGSHRWGLLNQGNFYGQDADLMRSGIQVPPGQAWEEVEAVLPRGGISFHHCLTFHGSGPNRSALPRRSFAVHLRTEKSRPKNDARAGLTQYIDDHTLCPIIYQARDAVAAR